MILKNAEWEFVGEKERLVDAEEFVGTGGDDTAAAQSTAPSHDALDLGGTLERCG